LNVPIQERGPAHSHDSSTLGALPKGLPPANPLSNVHWRSLLALGVSGGLVPCSDAIALLIVAAAIHRIALGLSMIVCFSLGLAAVLILIGLTIVQGKRLFARLRWFDRVACGMPVVSAIVLVALGVGLAFNAGGG
jgi:ABC-type nickel/cobalt efflux system permease component RcnA